MSRNTGKCAVLQGFAATHKIFSEQKAAYDKKYNIFRKLLSASNKSIPLSEIVDCIEKIVVDTGGKIMVKWNIQWVIHVKINF